jgi:Txe/YoeB family toxin of Txe-Axe toxin-antitoxin module
LDENGKILTGDVTNPEYEKYLREKIKYLVKEIGVDGFKEDWITFPINSETINSFWEVLNEVQGNSPVRWADTEEKLADKDAGDYYSANLVKHRFFDGKSIFRGEDLTLIIGEPHVDGMRWLYVFDSHKEIKEKGRGLI